MSTINYNALKAKYFGTEVPTIELNKINRENFFINESENGIISASDFLLSLNDLGNDKNGIEGLKEFFGALSEGRRFKFVKLRTDKGNNDYCWATYQIGCAERGFKLPFFDGLRKLLEISVKCDIDLSLEELITRAIKIHKKEVSKD